MSRRELTDQHVEGKVANSRIVVLDEPGAGGACHKYDICTGDNPAYGIVMGSIRFQDGPIQEAGVNGIQNEDLLAIVIDRLRGFQSGQFACEANREALMCVEMALAHLKDRTAERIARGVEGQNKA